MIKVCITCEKPIPAERLEAFPEAVRCVRCATLHPEPPRFDPNEVCAKASPSGQNGWSPSS